MKSGLEIKERFYIDDGVGGYKVYYKRGNYCFCYSVSFEDNGVMTYSKTQRIKNKLFESQRKFAFSFK